MTSIPPRLVLAYTYIFYVRTPPEVSLSSLAVLYYAACLAILVLYGMEPSLGIFGSLPMSNTSRFTFIFNCQILDTSLNFLFVPNDHIFILIVPNMAVCKNVVGTNTLCTVPALLLDLF